MWKWLQRFFAVNDDTAQKLRSELSWAEHRLDVAMRKHGVLSREALRAERRIDELEARLTEMA